MSSKAIKDVPIAYQIADSLGARIQVFDESSKKWISISYFTALAPETKYKIHIKDKNILKTAKSAIESMYMEVNFRNHTYFVPKNALDGKTPVLFMYGFGIYATVDKDGVVTEMDESSSKQVDENKDLNICVAQHSKTIFGKNIKPKK